MLYESSRKRFRPKVSPSHPNPGLRRKTVIKKRFVISPMKMGVKRTYVFCHFCGYTPKGNRTDLSCLKCGRHAWECGEISQRIVI